MFLSCDWGTSSFRLRLVGDQLDCIGSSVSDEGIASVYERWLAQGTTGNERLSFYQCIVKHHIQVIASERGLPLEGIPVIASGMVSSTMGMMELPYKKLPFAVENADLISETIAGSEDFDHPLVLISGIQTSNDVARGEETALLGSIRETNGEKQVYIFPGTHSKHMVVENGMVTGLKTYMTGEFFQLLSRHSILSKSIEANKDFKLPAHLSAFEAGVRDSTRTNILHASFMVRTNDLFKKFSATQNYWYLSGLLIGEELKHIKQAEAVGINLVSDGLMMDIYEAALVACGATSNLYKTKLEHAIIAGHNKVYRHYFH